MNQHRLLLSKLTFTVLLLAIFFYAWPSHAVDVSAKGGLSDGESMESVHGILAEMSDEQVRQMLIEELRKETSPEEQQSILENRVEGPGAPLSRLLQSFDSNSIDYENQLHRLLPWITNIPADLYKVFITL